MVRNISILGSTGSIGTQALEVIDDLKYIKVWAVSTNTNIDLLERQIRKYKPVIAAVMDESAASVLRQRVKDLAVKVLAGLDGLIQVATMPEAEMVVASVVGIVGLIPTVEAIKAGKHIALANKETLVTAGNIVMKEARQKGVLILPVDSEHSAIFQCLQQKESMCVSMSDVNKLILTASGGPFLGKKRPALQRITPQEALKHPKWDMGSKISIDSATLMNKGLEVIEAKWLFDMDIEKIQVVIHPQSIIHSMVEYVDYSIIAQMGLPDMKLPIQYALTYPKRLTCAVKPLDFTEHTQITFKEPDIDTFGCLALAYKAAKLGGTIPTVLNVANEVAVDWFLKGKIKFLDIEAYIEYAMERHNNIKDPMLKDILEVDSWARACLEERIGDNI